LLKSSVLGRRRAHAEAPHLLDEVSDVRVAVTANNVPNVPNVHSGALDELDSDGGQTERRAIHNDRRIDKEGFDREAVL